MRCLGETSMRRPAGANPARSGVSPPGPVASLATVPATGPAKRRHVGRGEVASKARTFRMPSVLFCAKAMAISPWIFSKRRRGKEGSGPAGGCTTARGKRTAQEPGRSLPLLEGIRCCGEPGIRLRRAARPQGHARPVQKKPLHRGRPPARGTEATAEGGEEVGGLHTSCDAGEGSVNFRV